MTTSNSTLRHTQKDVRTDALTDARSQSLSGMRDTETDQPQTHHGFCAPRGEEPRGCTGPQGPLGFRGKARCARSLRHSLPLGRVLGGDLVQLLPARLEVMPALDGARLHGVLRVPEGDLGVQGGHSQLRTIGTKGHGQS